MNASRKFCVVLTIILLLAIVSSPVSAITYEGGVILAGTYIEIGVNRNGYFGTAAPGGYHNNAGNLGFVADYQKDGWGSGTPPYGGDYFTPGSPYEGFGVAWTTGADRLYSNAGGAGAGIPTIELTETSSGTTKSAVWVGEVAQGNEKLRIIQTYSFKTNDLYFTMNVQLINTGTVTLSAVKYERGVDPDNELPWAGSFTTDNLVVHQPGVGGNVDKALVTARGITYPNMLLGLGTIDSRAKVSAQTADFAINPNEVLTQPISATTSDSAIGLAYNLGSLAPGQSVSFDLAYILSVNDLDLALGNLAAVTISGPTGTISGTAVPFLVTTNNVPATSKVDFYVNGVLIGSDTTPNGGIFETTFNSTAYTNGPLNIRAVATISGSTYEKTSTVTVDNSGPPISFITPLSGEVVSGDNIPVTISHDALNPPVSVVFYRESGGDSALLGTDTTPPFTTTFNTSGLPIGASIIIRAVATNAVSATSNITVGVVKASTLPPTSFSAASPPDGSYGSAYSYTFSANGVPAPTYSIVSGTLPPGLTLDSTTGLLSGTPTAAGPYNSIVVRASNASGSIDSSPFNINIAKADPSISMTSSTNPSVFGQGTTFTVNLSAGYGTPGGSVTFYDGIVNLGTAAVSDGSASFSTSSLTVGSHSLQANYSGDSNFNAASPTAVTQVVNKANSLTSITSDLPDPSVYGQSYNASVSVTAVAPGAGTPSGTVTISDGANSCGPITLTAGNGSCTLPSNAAGAKILSAAYSGDGSFNSSDDTEGHVVARADTEISISTPYNPAPYGAPLQITAAVVAETHSGTTPVGQVQFYLDGEAYGDPVDLEEGTALSSLLPEDRGTYEISASYLGTANYNPADAVSFDQVIEKAGTTTVVTSSLNPSTYGQNVMFTATVTANSPSLAIPGGTVQFKLDGVNYGAPVALNASGIANRTIPYTALWPDVHLLTAVYSPTANFIGSDNLSAPFEQTVHKASPVLTITPQDEPIVSGQITTLTLKAAASPAYIGIPTGTVSLFLDRNPYAGPLTLGSSGTVSVPNFSSTSGSHEFTLHYDGDDYFAATIISLTDPVTISKADSAATITGFEPAELVVGQPVTVSVSVENVLPGVGIPGGQVVVSNGADECVADLVAGSGSCLLTPSAPGNPDLTAHYLGDSEFNESNAPALAGPQVVKADTHFESMGYSPNEAVVGQTITIQAEVKVSAPGSGIATGNILISNGVDECTISLVDGEGDCQFIPTEVGQPNLTAVYEGDENFNGTDWDIPGPNVIKADTVISSVLADPAEVVVGQLTTISFSVSVDEPGSGTPEGEVTVSFGDDQCTGALVDGEGSCELTPIAPGSDPMQLAYSGDDRFNASSGDFSGLTVEKADTAIIDLSFVPEELVVGQPTLVSLTVEVSNPGSGIPSGTVTVSNGSDECEITLTDGAGSCEFTPAAPGSPDLSAVYGGDTRFNESSLTAAGPQVSKAGSSITTFTLDPGEVVVGQPVTVNIAVSVDEPGSGVASGTVVISNGVDECLVTLVEGAGTCQLTPTASGTPPVTATYAGDDNFNGDIREITGLLVNPADTIISGLSFDPALLVVGQPTSVMVVVSASAPGSGVPGGTVTVGNGAESCEIELVEGTGACLLTPTATGQPNLSAVYDGDENFNGSEAAFGGPLVSKGQTTTLLSSTMLPPVYGQPVSFTASVSVNSPASGEAGGYVQFYVDGNLFGDPVALEDGTAASIEIDDLELGIHLIAAQYSGDDFFAGSSASIPQLIVPASTSVALESTRNPAPYGETVMVIATVTANDPSLAIPSGYVQFKVNGVNYGAAIALNASGKAEKVLPYTALWVGTHTVTAEFLGNPRFFPSSNTFMQVIGLGESEISVTPSVKPSVFGQALTFQVTVAPTSEQYMIPSGNVSISVDGVTLGAAMTLDETGKVTSIPISTLDVGIYDIQISYEGDEQYAPKSAAFTNAVEVTKGDTTTEISAFETDDLMLGDTLQVSVVVQAAAPAAGTPSGKVIVSNGADECEATLVSGVGTCNLQFTRAGQFDLTASYQGSDSFNASESEEAASPLVEKEYSSVTLESMEPQEVVTGQPVTFSVLVSSAGYGIPTGTVTIGNGVDSCEAVIDESGQASCNWVPSQTGSFDIDIDYGGDDNFHSSGITLKSGPEVSKAQAVIQSVSFDPQNPVAGENVVITVTLGVEEPGSGTPTGTLRILIGGELCEVTLVDGVGECEFIAPGTGVLDITVGYDGDENFDGFADTDYESPSTSAADTTVTISGPTSARSSQPVQWTAVVAVVAPGSGTPGGSVQFYIDGVEFGSPLSLTDGAATSPSISSLGSGVHHITAQYLGNDAYNESASAEWVFMVNPYRVFFPLIFR